MKWSEYNIVFHQYPDLFVYNSVSGKIFVSQSDALPVDPMCVSEKIGSVLKRDGFLVDSDEDEFLQLLKKSKAFSESPDNEDVDITIALSLKCNMKCDYCFEKTSFSGKIGGVMSKEAQKATIDHILQIVEREGVKTLKVTWFGGEPMLNHKTILDISARIKQGLPPSVQFISRIITNGALLTRRKLLDLINECNLRFVQIAVDGGKTRYTRVRHVDDSCYEQVIENIITSCELVPTRIRLNATPDNIEELYSLADTLLNRIGSLSNMSFTLSEVTNYTDNSSSIRFFEPGRFRNELRKFHEFLYKKGLEASYNYTEKYYPIGCKYFLKNNVAIDPQGFLYKCEHHFGEAGYVLGDVFSGINADNKKMHIYEVNRIDARCRHCQVYPICKYASCADYRRFMGSGNQCLCKQGQLESISEDILGNRDVLPIYRIDTLK